MVSTNNASAWASPADTSVNDMGHPNEWELLVQHELANFLDWEHPTNPCQALAHYMDALPEDITLSVQWAAYRTYLAYVLGDWDTVADGLETWENTPLNNRPAKAWVLFSLVGGATLMAENYLAEALSELRLGWDKRYAVGLSHAFWPLVTLQLMGMMQKLQSKRQNDWAITAKLWLQALPLAIGSSMLFAPCRTIIRFLLAARVLTHTPANAPEQLIATLSHLHQQFPGQTVLHNALGKTFAALNKTEQAAHWFEQSTQRYPLTATTWLQLGQLQEKTHQPEAALKSYQSALAYGPDHATLWLRLGRLHLQLSQSLVTAATYFKQALLIAKTDELRADAAHALGQCTLLENSTDEASLQVAQSLFEKAYQWDNKTSRFAQSLAMTYYQLQQYAEAEALYRQLIETNPNDAGLVCSLGYLCWLQGDGDDAAFYYRQAVVIDPNYDVAYNNLGVVYLEDRQDAERALDLFEKAVKINLDYATAHYNLGRCYRAMGDTFKAATCFQWAKQLADDSEELDGSYLDGELQSLFKVS